MKRRLWVAGLLCVVVTLVGWSYVNAFLKRPLHLTAPVIMEIKRGEGLRIVSERLGRVLDLSHPVLLNIYGRMSGMAGRLHVGEYEIKNGDTPLTVLRKFVRGEVLTYQFTMVEGWTVNQLITALGQLAKLEKRLQPDASAADVIRAVGIEGYGHIEGLFFPDTYQYVKGMSDVDLLRLAHKRLLDVLDSEWQARGQQLPYATPYEALVMASLVEKETGAAEERPRIAGVFVRRLEQKMLLQTDPAVIYGLGVQYQGNLTRQHLQTPSPYNTYLMPGLPPTPIALVGREAIRAALHPDRSDKALYFVARGDGSHEFNDTLEKHQKAVNRFQIDSRSRHYRSSPPAGNGVKGGGE